MVDTKAVVAAVSPCLPVLAVVIALVLAEQGEE